MFEVKPKASVKLVHVQTRMEKHGEELVPAVDIDFEWVTGNHVLDQLHPQLRGLLFSSSPDGSEPELDMAEEVLSCVRVSTLGYPLKLSGEQHHMTLMVQGHAFRNQVLQLTGCTVKKWRLTPLEGGSVLLGFQVQSAHEIDAEVSGALDMWQQKSVVIELTLSEAEGADVGELLGKDEKARRKGREIREYAP